MHPKHGKPIILQGPRKKKKKPRIVQPSTVETEPEPEVPMKREMSKDELEEIGRLYGIELDKRLKKETLIKQLKELDK